MNKIQKKALHIFEAIANVYRSEENDCPEVCGNLRFSEDVTEDFTAMLVAMSLVFDRIVGGNGDLIDFTHVLNKLAVQYIMDGERKDNAV